MNLTNLNGWKRLGVVISIAWFICVLAFVAEDINGIDDETWMRKKVPNYSYAIESHSRNGFFNFQKPVEAFKFVPADEAEEKSNGVNFDDLIPKERKYSQDIEKPNFFDQFDEKPNHFAQYGPPLVSIVEFKWIKFMAMVVGPIFSLWLMGLAFVWVKNGFLLKARK